MFTALSEQLTGILSRLRGRGVLSESDVTDALRDSSSRCASSASSWKGC